MMNKSTEDKRDLSIYIHIPFCKSRCSYCDFLSFGGCDYRQQKEYTDALLREIRAYAQYAGAYIVRTVFIGGGTPSYMEPALLEQVVAALRETFRIAPDAEITMEGNPDSLRTERLRVYRDMGVNRLSIGLQSANDATLKAVGRVHNYDQFVAAFTSARQVGFENINVDVMSALPGEDMDAYIRTLAKVVSMQPEHISAYSLIVEEGTPLAENAALLATLPSEETDRLMYMRTKLLLGNSGYERYEISNYAKKGYACRHNLVYWTGGEYLGLGLGASSYLTLWDGQTEPIRLRFRGTDDPGEYKRMQYQNLPLAEFLGACYKEVEPSQRKDRMEEFMFLGLRLRQGISKKEFRNRFAVPIEEIYADVIREYTTQQLLVEEGDRLFLSERGIDVSNRVMAAFML